MKANLNSILYRVNFRLHGIMHQRCVRASCGQQAANTVALQRNLKSARSFDSVIAVPATRNYRNV